MWPCARAQKLGAVAGYRRPDPLPSCVALSLVLCLFRPKAGAAAKPKAKKKKAKQKAGKAEEAGGAGGPAAAGAAAAGAAAAELAAGAASKASTAPGSSRSSKATSPVRSSGSANPHQSGSDSAAALPTSHLPLAALELLSESDEDEEEQPDPICLAARTSLLHRPVTALTSLTAFRVAHQRQLAVQQQEQQQQGVVEQGKGIHEVHQEEPGSPASTVDAPELSDIESVSSSSSSEDEAQPTLPQPSSQGPSSSPPLGRQQAAAGPSEQAGPTPPVGMGPADVAAISEALGGWLRSLGLQQHLAVETRGSLPLEQGMAAGCLSPKASTVALPGGGTLELRWNPPPHH